MVDAIDPVAAKVNAGLVIETPKVEPVTLSPDHRSTDDLKARAVTQAHTARDATGAPPETSPRPGFEMHIDGATLRMYSEMRDPDTKRVIQRIPAGYQPKVEPPRDYEPTEFET